MVQVDDTLVTQITIIQRTTHDIDWLYRDLKSLYLPSLRMPVTLLDL